MYEPTVTITQISKCYDLSAVIHIIVLKTICGEVVNQQQER